MAEARRECGWLKRSSLNIGLRRLFNINIEGVQNFRLAFMENIYEMFFQTNDGNHPVIRHLWMYHTRKSTGGNGCNGCYRKIWDD